MPDTQRPQLKLVMIAAGIVVLGLTALLLLNVLQRSTAPDDSSAGANSKFTLSRISPISDLLEGDFITVAVAADDTAGADVAELVVTFDPEVLNIEEITETSGLLALNKNRDNNTGRLTIDMANPEGDFTANSTLTVLRFSVKDPTPLSTTIRVDPASTLGFPNIIAPSGFGTLDIKLSTGGSLTTSVSTVNTTSNTSLANSSLASVSSSITSLSSEQSTSSAESSQSTSTASFTTSFTSFTSFASSSFTTSAVTSATSSAGADSSGGNIIDQNPVVFMMVAITGAIATAAGAAGLWFSGKNETAF